MTILESIFGCGTSAADRNDPVTKSGSRDTVQDTTTSADDQGSQSTFPSKDDTQTKLTDVQKYALDSMRPPKKSDSSTHTRGPALPHEVLRKKLTKLSTVYPHSRLNSHREVPVGTQNKTTSFYPAPTALCESRPYVQPDARPYMQPDTRPYMQPETRPYMPPDSLSYTATDPRSYIAIDPAQAANARPPYTHADTRDAYNHLPPCTHTGPYGPVAPGGTVPVYGQAPTYGQPLAYMRVSSPYAQSPGTYMQGPPRYVQPSYQQGHTLHQRGPPTYTQGPPSYQGSAAYGDYLQSFVPEHYGDLNRGLQYQSYGKGYGENVTCTHGNNVPSRPRGACPQENLYAARAAYPHNPGYVNSHMPGVCAHGSCRAGPCGQTYVSITGSPVENAQGSTVYQPSNHFVTFDYEFEQAAGGRGIVQTNAPLQYERPIEQGARYSNEISPGENRFVYPHSHLVGQTARGDFKCTVSKDLSYADGSRDGPNREEPKVHIETPSETQEEQTARCVITEYASECVPEHVSQPRATEQHASTEMPPLSVAAAPSGEVTRGISVEGQQSETMQQNAKENSKTEVSAIDETALSSHELVNDQEPMSEKTPSTEQVPSTEHIPPTEKTCVRGSTAGTSFEAANQLPEKPKTQSSTGQSKSDDIGSLGEKSGDISSASSAVEQRRSPNSMESMYLDPAAPIAARAKTSKEPQAHTVAGTQTTTVTQTPTPLQIGTVTQTVTAEQTVETQEIDRSNVDMGTRSNEKSVATSRSVPPDSEQESEAVQLLSESSQKELSSTVPRPCNSEPESGGHPTPRREHQTTGAENKRAPTNVATSDHAPVAVAPVPNTSAPSNEGRPTRMVCTSIDLESQSTLEDVTGEQDICMKHLNKQDPPSTVMPGLTIHSETSRR